MHPTALALYVQGKRTEYTVQHPTVPSPPCHSPEKGARLLFFSGGTALRDTARELTAFTHNSVHLITTFDSGGSSATLRHYFSMPAIGDIRNRITALADLHKPGVAEIHALFAYRLPVDDSEQALQAELVRLVRGRHPLLKQVPASVQLILQNHLIWFALHMPQHFPLAGASVGNLLLAAGYLNHKRRLCPVIAQYARMVQARGMVRPIVEAPAHLAVRLESGEVIVGQHLFTGKGAGALASPIQDMWLTPHEHTQERVAISIHGRTAERIRKAHGICFPIGSFYSSVLANLLPAGVGRAVADAPCPKVFVPNLGKDPELVGHDVQMQVERLVETLRRDAPQAKPRDVLSFVLADEEKGSYPGGLPRSWLAKQGIVLVHRTLMNDASAPLADARLLAGALADCGGIV